jgi:hypothetical protein
MLATCHLFVFSQVRIKCKDFTCFEKSSLSFQVLQRTGCGKGPYPAGSVGAYCNPTKGMEGDVFGLLTDAAGNKLPSTCKINVPSSSPPNGGNSFNCVYESNVTGGQEQNVGTSSFYLQELSRTTTPGVVSYRGDLVSHSPDYISFLPNGRRVFSFVHFEAPHPSGIQV